MFILCKNHPLSKDYSMINVETIASFDTANDDIWAYDKDGQQYFISHHATDIVASDGDTTWDTLRKAIIQDWRMFSSPFLESDAERERKEKEKEEERNKEYMKVCEEQG